MQKLVEWMKQSQCTVALTGAGMSTESGLKDFRSKDGWWRGIDPSTVATVDALTGNYELFHEFYKVRIDSFRSAQPHDGHRILAAWERAGRLHSVITQNVDGFHHQAGNKRVRELHGSIRSFRCQHCGTSAEEEDFLSKIPCTSCGGPLRPNVVLFGEMLPQVPWQEAIADLKQAELVFVIGTSLQVSPVNQLPSLTRGKVVYINVDTEGGGHYFDLVVQGKAKGVLQQLDGWLNKT